MDTAASDGEVVRFDFYRLSQSAQYRLRPHLFAGGGLHFDSHADVRADDGAEATWPDSEFYQYSVANGLPLDTQRSVGPKVEIIFDSRDNYINPDRGWLARAGYRAMFEGFLGGASDWHRVTLDLRVRREEQLRHLPRRTGGVLT
jgi:outer membrane protein assembly factor BamA